MSNVLCSVVARIQENYILALRREEASLHMGVTVSVVLIGRKHELRWSTRCFVYTMLSVRRQIVKFSPLPVVTWCHVDETLQRINEGPPFSVPLFMTYDIQKQLEKSLIQSSE